jgi:archaellum component FlaF (FlaF/FlaG flagellin family)
MKTTILTFSLIISGLLFTHNLKAQEKSKEITPVKTETVKSPKNEQVKEIKNENKSNTQKITVTEEGTDSNNNTGTDNTTKTGKQPLNRKMLVRPVKIDANREKITESQKNKDKSTENK